MNYLKLIGVIILVILAYASFAGCGMLLQEEWRGMRSGSWKERWRKKVRRSVIPASLLFGLMCAWGAYAMGQSLVSAAPEVFAHFGLWYLIGFSARMVLMIVREQIFSGYFATDWGEVLDSLFLALLGPIQIFLVIRYIRKHKPWY